MAPIMPVQNKYIDIQGGWSKSNACSLIATDLITEVLVTYQNEHKKSLNSRSPPPFLLGVF